MKFSPQPGSFLKSTSSSEDEVFGNTIILLTQADASGAMGFMLNKKYPRRFNELVEFADSPPFPLQEGGPVEHEKLFFLHCRPDMIDNGLPLADTIFYGGDFKEAVFLLNKGLINEDDIKMFIGYCGWDAGQLENEIETGEWSILENYKVF